MTSLNEFIAWALSDSGAKHFENAAAKCRAFLDEKPDSPDLLHLMGVIEFQRGRLDSAKTWIEKGLAQRPDSVEMLCNYGYVLLAQKKYAEAIGVFNRCIALHRDFTKAYCGLGAAYQESGRDDDAIEAYNRACAIDGKNHTVLNDLGVLLKKKGAHEQAAIRFTQAITARPDYPPPLNNLGLLYLSMGNSAAAEDLFRKALACSPEYPEALNNLGTVLHNRGDFEGSAALYAKALAARPGYTSALNNLGAVLCQQGAFADSIAICGKALAVAPNHPEALNNLGNALEAAGELPQAITAYKQAIAVKSDHAEYHKNLGMALLAAGRFDEGWPEYEWRWKTKQFADALPNTQKPLWAGEEAQGRVLLIRAEQGFGDTVQFCRFAPLAAARGLRVMLEVQPSLVSLMKSLSGVERVFAQGEPLADHDVWRPMMSLPMALKTRLETIPAETPYLGAKAENIDAWRDRLKGLSGSAMKVGLAWAGKPRIQSPDLMAADRRRSIAPELLAPLMDCKGVRFYSLQKGGPSAPGEFGIIDCLDVCVDFADTAALIAGLDLVISVDTAVAHVAGALGKPVWLLNRFDNCWRWLRGREDSPWYPTMRLFRQPSPGDWKSVLLRVKNELEKAAADLTGSDAMAYI
jgi:Tfp pilus assembly protein PilF